MKKLFVMVLILALVMGMSAFTTPAVLAEENDVYAEFVFVWTGDFCRITNNTEEGGEVIYVRPEDVVGELTAEKATEYHMTWDAVEEAFVLDALRADGSLCARSWYSTEMWAATLERMMEHSELVDFRVTGWSAAQGNFVVSLEVDGEQRSEIVMAEYFEGGTKEEYRLDEVVNYLNSDFPEFDWTCFGRVNRYEEVVRFDIFVPEHNITYFVEAHIDENGDVVADYEDMYNALALMKRNEQE